MGTRKAGTPKDPGPPAKTYIIDATLALIMVSTALLKWDSWESWES